MRKKKSERTRLIEQLDKAFSKFIRTRYTDAEGFGECFTCGDRRHWSEVDAGHFQSRRKFPTRWDELNVQFQCKKCNMTNGGQQYIFGQRLNEIYGDGTAEAIIHKSNEKRKFSVDELRDILSKITQRLEQKEQ